MKNKEEKEQQFTLDQILNELRVSGRNRDVLVIKHLNKKMIKSEWEKLFKKEGF